MCVASTDILHKDYLYEVDQALSLFAINNIHGGCKALTNATKAMVINRPDLMRDEIQLLNTNADPAFLDKIDNVVKWFANYVAHEK